jgi:hypothetical protein
MQGGRTRHRLATPNSVELPLTATGRRLSLADEGRLTHLISGGAQHLAQTRIGLAWVSQQSATTNKRVVTNTTNVWYALQPIVEAPSTSLAARQLAAPPTTYA